MGSAARRDLRTSSEFRWAVARRAVKVDAVLGFENRKAFGNEIHFYVERATELCNLGSPGVFAPRTPKNFSPMAVSGHPSNMRLNRSRSSQLFCHNSSAERGAILRARMAALAELRPIDDLEDHSALEHFRRDIRSVALDPGPAQDDSLRSSRSNR